MDTKTFPVEGIKHLVIEQVGRDARVRGEPDATLIQVTYLPASSQLMGDFGVQGETLTFRNGIAVQVSLPPGLAITVYEAAGDLRVQDLNGAVTIDAVRGDLRLRNLVGTIQAGRVDGSLRADHVSSLRVSECCAGDLRVEEGEGLSVEKVNGDARLFELHTGRLAHVHGDFWAERVLYDLEIGRAEGDVRLADIGGLATVLEASGDLRAAALGGLAAQRVQGDADLRGPFGAEHEYSLVTAGDITLVLPLGADLRLTAQAAGRIRSDIQLTPATDGSALFTATLGRATGRASIDAGGDLRLIQGDAPKPAPEAGPVRWADSGDLGERIRQQVNAALSAAGIDPAARQLGLEREDDAPGRGTRSARAPRGASSARNLPSQRWRNQPAQPFAGPTETEQLAILKMVEAGTITAAEAEVLLRALEG